MNLENIFAGLARLETTATGSRRHAFRYLGRAGQAIASAALPTLLSGVFQKAHGQAAISGDVIAALKLALSLEYLEYYFYYTATGDASKNIAASPFFTQLSAAEQQALIAMRDDEKGHLTTLSSLLGNATIADPTAGAFDYSAGASKLAPFDSLAAFLALAQAFEDLGVRAYKGALATLINNKDMLATALAIHSVEARHASHIRTLRRGGVGVAGADAGGPNDSLPKSWVSLRENDGPVPALTAAVYGPGLAATTTAGVVPASPAENNITQARVNVQTNATSPGAGLLLTEAAASEAFDEPLDAAQVKAIALHFVVGGSQNLYGLFS